MSKGDLLNDGYQTLISFTGAGVTFEEISIQPPGLDNGEPIDTTTMRNAIYRTKSPRVLQTTTDGEVTVAYNPEAYGTWEGHLGINQQIVITWPDLRTRTFWGYAKTFIPDALEEGKRPTAKITIVETNQDNDGAEVDPADGAGTGTA